MHNSTMCFIRYPLTRWGHATCICVSKLSIIASAWAAPNHYMYMRQYGIIVKWIPGSTLQWNLNRNWDIFVPDSEFENVVWKIAAILSRPQCVELAFSKESKTPLPPLNISLINRSIYLHRETGDLCYNMKSTIKFRPVCNKVSVSRVL